jgi:predicted membrane protein
MTGRVIGGVILIVLGIVFLLDQLGIAQIGGFVWRLWPLILVVVGVVQLANSPRNWIGPAILIGLGAIFLIDSFGILGISAWALIWPLGIILVGAAILLNQTNRRSRHDDDEVPVGDDTVNASATFGSHKARSTSQAFRGGSVSATFGEVKLDLRDAVFAPGGATLAANATFGNVEVRVPMNTRVILEGTPFLGDVSDHTTPRLTEGEPPTLRVLAAAFLGGVSIRD